MALFVGYGHERGHCGSCINSELEMRVKGTELMKGLDWVVCTVLLVEDAAKDGRSSTLRGCIMGRLKDKVRML